MGACQGLQDGQKDIITGDSGQGTLVSLPFSYGPWLTQTESYKSFGGRRRAAIEFIENAANLQKAKADFILVRGRARGNWYVSLIRRPRRGPEATSRAINLV